MKWLILVPLMPCGVLVSIFFISISKNSSDETARSGNLLFREKTSYRDGNDKRNLRQNQYDCDKGIDLSPTKNGPPVCGEDGLVYENKCVAICQHVGINQKFTNSTGTDDEYPYQFMIDDTYIGDVTIPMAVLNLYQTKNFKFVGWRKLYHLQGNQEAVEQEDESKESQENGASNNESPVQDKTKCYKSSTNRVKALGIHRITREGLEYFAFREDIDPDQEAQDYQGYEGVSTSEIDEEFFGTNDYDGNDNGGYRRLQDFERVSSPQVYPYRTIGELDSQRTDIYESTNTNLQGGCTGFVVSRVSAVTAAHCIYDKGRLSPRVNFFAPGRYRLSSGTVYSPYGIWEFSYVDIHPGWVFGEKPAASDLAVITYKPHDGRLIGDVVGYLGFAPRANDADELQDAVIPGYSGSRPNGEMWVSSSCSFWDSVHPQVTNFNCHAEGGMSGSPLLDLETNQAYGVLVGGTAAFNYGVMFDADENFWYIQDKAERDDIGNIQNVAEEACLDLNIYDFSVDMQDCGKSLSQDWFFRCYRALDNPCNVIVSAQNTNLCLSYHPHTKSFVTAVPCDPYDGWQCWIWDQENGSFISRDDMDLCLMVYGAGLLRMTTCLEGGRKPEICPLCQVQRML